MRVFKTLDSIFDIENTVIAMGNFDGVHRGHRELIRRTVRGAEVANIRSAVFTFSNHPRNLLAKGGGVKNIQYDCDKEFIIRTLGIDYMFNIPFDEGIMSVSPVNFIKDILIDTMKMQEIYCGYNNKFGHKAEGDVHTLVDESIRLGFGIHILEPYKVDDTIVSSSLVRKMIEEGNIETCNRLLGRLYSIGGDVVVGNQLGKSLGFPTSNMVIDSDMVTPSNGVYVTNCIYNNVNYPSITNVGIKPTIGDYSKNLETHIFNFDKELYGKHIRVEFLKKIRDEKKFDSIEALSKQITADCIKVRSIHREHTQMAVDV